ncbi:MAG: hypothetical protein ACYTG6_11660 [Planctomycetota bacterium]
MPARPSLAWLLAACCLFAAGRPASSEVSLRTRHLEIRGDVAPRWIQEAGELGEALFSALRDRFGGAPGSAALPLRVRLLPDREAFLAALPEQDAAGRLEGAGGWTSLEEGISYVWIQAEDFDTRRLVLHELTHQFQDRLAPASRRAPDWYREGIAEHYGWHRRTPDGPVFGALDVVARNVRPREAAARALSDAFDPWGIATGSRPADWTDGLILVHAFLRTSDAELLERFLAWEAEAVRRGDEGTLFARRFGGMPDRLGRAVRDVWSGEHFPWLARHRGWDEGASGIVGRAGIGPTLLERLVPGPYATWSVDVARGEALGAGPAIGVRDEQTWIAVEVRRTRVVVVRQAPSGERILAQSPLAAPYGVSTLTVGVTPLADGLRVEVAGTGVEGVFRVDLAAAQLTADDLEGRVGLVVRGGTARFSRCGLSFAPDDPPGR